MNRVIQYIGSLDRGGAQSAIMNLYRRVDRKKWQFDFVTHDEHEGELEHEVSSLGARVFRIPKLQDAGYHAFRDNWIKLLSAHPEWQILHSHMRSTASLVIPVAKTNGLATIVSSHSTSNGRGAKAFIKMLLQIPIRKEADFLIGCSREAGEWLFGRKACQSNSYLYLPNAIDIGVYRYDAGLRQKIRSELGLGNSLVFGHVGRLHESKNHVFLLRVFEGLLRKYPHAKLLLVGEGPLRNDIEEQIDALGIRYAVCMLGNRSDVPALLQAMDVFLFPSKWEGLPVSVVEALCAGLPCYVSDSITHDIDIHESIVRLSIDDPEKWVDAISNISRVDATEAIRDHGFDINDSVRALTAMYQNAVAVSRVRKSDLQRKLG